MTPEIDCEYTPDIVCPWCGHAQGDSWEYFREGYDGHETEVECASCDKAFLVTQDVTITYTLRKP